MYITIPNVTNEINQFIHSLILAKTTIVNIGDNFSLLKKSFNLIIECVKSVTTLV